MEFWQRKRQEGLKRIQERPCEDTVRSLFIYDPRREALGETEPINILIVDLRLPELLEIQFGCLSHESVEFYYDSPSKLMWSTNTYYWILIFIDTARKSNFFVCFLFCFGLFFRATPAAYGSSQARDWIRAAAAGLHHSSWQRQIHKPLNEARNPTCILMNTSRVLNLLSHSGNFRMQYLLQFLGILILYNFSSVPSIVSVSFQQFACFGFAFHVGGFPWNLAICSHSWQHETG